MRGPLFLCSFSCAQFPHNFPSMLMQPAFDKMKNKTSAINARNVFINNPHPHPLRSKRFSRFPKLQPPFRIFPPSIRRKRQSRGRKPSAKIPGRQFGQKKRRPKGRPNSQNPKPTVVRARGACAGRRGKCARRALPYFLCFCRRLLLCRCACSRECGAPEAPLS